MIEGLDKECEKLVKVLNKMNGIATIESCCGHLTAPYRIWFVSNSFSAVGILYRSVDRRYSDGKWRIEVDCSDRIPTNGFLLTSVEPFMSDSDMEESVDALINNIQYWCGDEYEDYFRELKSIDEYKVEADIERKNNMNKYIGKYVHAGGELNGIIGYIVDVENEYDELFGNVEWFYIQDEENGAIERYAKEELKEITIGIIYKDLE